MAPRFQTLRPAQTASAREAMRSFFCDLCQKGYSRMNEYEAHLSSYDHSHKQRLKDMKAMVRDPVVTARARRQEAKADAVISIKLGNGGGGPNDNEQSTPGGNGGSGFKKGGFRKGGFKSAFVATEEAVAEKNNQTPAETIMTTMIDPTQQPLPAIYIPSVPASASLPSTSAPAAVAALPPPLPLVAVGRNSTALGDESDTEDEDYEMYDPRRPTD